MRCTGNGDREQRPKNDLRAFIHRLLGRLLRTLRAGAVVLHQQLDVRALEFDQRQLGGIAHRLRGDARIARARQRQNQSHLDRAGADRRRLLRRTCRCRRRTLTGEIIRDGRLHAGATGEHGASQKNAQRRPARGARARGKQL